MDRNTKELKESCTYDTLSLKRINVSCHKRTTIPESETLCLILTIVFAHFSFFNLKISLFPKHIHLGSKNNFSFSQDLDCR